MDLEKVVTRRMQHKVRWDREAEAKAKASKRAGGKNKKVS